MIRVLLDQGLPRTLAGRLGDIGWEATHVFDLGMSRAADREILAYARRDSMTVITVKLPYAPSKCTRRIRPNRSFVPVFQFHLNGGFLRLAKTAKQAIKSPWTRLNQRCRLTALCKSAVRVDGFIATYRAAIADGRCATRPALER